MYNIKNINFIFVNQELKQRKIYTNKNSFSFLFTFLAILAIVNSNYLRMEISDINYKKNSSFDFISTILSNEIYTNLSIGTPIQTLKIILKSEEQTFYITEKKYNRSISSTYLCEKVRGIYFFDEIQQGIDSNDTMYLISKNNSLEKFNLNSAILKFILVFATKGDKAKQIDGSIGLQIKDLHYYGIPNFFDELKKSKLINNYQWAIKYKKNKKDNKDNEKMWNTILHSDFSGEFYVGFNEDEYGDLFQIKNRKYQLKKVRTESDNDNIFWSLYFDDIYFSYEWKNQIKINYEGELVNIRKQLEKKFVQLLLTKDYYLGTKEFKLLINEEFFNYYFENNICSKDEIKIDWEIYTYYKCDNSSGKFQIKKFPNINFHHYELNYTFVLTYKDLFITDENDESKNYFYFNVFFALYQNTNWMFGRNFFEKYQFIFESDKKMIGFLLPETTSLSKTSSFLENNKNIIIIMIIIIIILLLFGGFILFKLGSFLGKNFAKYKRYNKKKKAKANELIEEFYP